VMPPMGGRVFVWPDRVTHPGHHIVGWPN
jgi:hypothetical protein